MTSRTKLIILYGVSVFISLSSIGAAHGEYLANGQRIRSKGKTTYFIDPVKGDDQQAGTQAAKPWRTFVPLGKRILAAGDRVEIVSPGSFHESFILQARGAKNAHVTVHFAPGVYHFYRDGAYKTKLNISNTNDTPDSLKAIALYIHASAYTDITGSGAKLVMHGKLMETFVDHSEHITLRDISYDYFRPTVSELRVASTGQGFADLEIHPDSWYRIKDSVLTWEGEGWSYQPISLWQVFDKATGNLHRTDIRMEGLRYIETGKNRVRAIFAKNPGFVSGRIYQNRDITRDCAGIFLQRSTDVQLRAIRIYYMHGMGVVSQFCNGITIDSVQVKPDDASGRTCAAWADILHFSGCRGTIEISRSYLSAANDDAINIHGTYLRIVASPQPNQVQVRFMHSQTFGFEAFTPGDSIALLHSASLLPYAGNVVIKADKLDEKNILLTLQKPLAQSFTEKDVVENTTWTPSAHIRDNTITHIPTRGILVTTPGKVVIENNRLLRTSGSGIAIADDANSWFESGQVKDVTIRKNKFSFCGEPAITISPENTEAGYVHNHMAILDNIFDLQGHRVLFAKSTSGIRITGNVFNVADKTKAVDELFEFEDCADTMIMKNQILTETLNRH